MKNIAINLLCFMLLISGSAANAQEKVGNIAEFDKTVYDFGDVMLSDGPLSCTFNVKNISQKPMLIHSVVTSCGCTDVKWTREPVMPGKSGSISAVYTNDEGPYPFDKSLTVYISGIGKPVILRLRGISHEKQLSLEEMYTIRFGSLGMKETEMKCGNLEQGESRSDEVTVANLSSSPLKVDFTEVSPNLSIRVTPNPVPPRSTAKLQFTVASDSDIWGKNDMVIQTQITNKRGKKKNAPYLVELDRYFSPTARSLNVEETELAEKSLSAITYTDETYDLPDTLVSELPDSIKVHNLGEVEVKARKLMASQRPAIEYVVAEEVDKMIDTQVRDYADNIVDFLRRTNPYFLDRYMYVMDPITLRLKLIRDCFYRGRRVHFLLRDEVYKFCGDNWNSLNCVETIPLRSIERIQITENMDSVVIRLIPYPDDKYKYEKPGYRLTRLQGYSIPAEFYHADYSHGVLPDEADYRRTLYWNPAVATDSLGRAYIDFYNNESSVFHKVDIETLSEEGNMTFLNIK